MFNEAQLSLSGYVATDPRSSGTGTVRSRTTLRVAWTPRWIDRATGEWADGQTSFITVVCWRKLADNVVTCIHKGDPVMVKGRLTIRPYDDKEGVSKLSVECDAVSVGHDLSRGVAVFQRTRAGAGLTPVDQHMAAAAAAAQPGGDGTGGGPFGDGGTGGGPFGDGGLIGDGRPPAGGPAGDSMFDEGAIAALVPDADSVPAPF
jgi:single-strand DNA-binding protein